MSDTNEPMTDEADHDEGAVNPDVAEHGADIANTTTATEDVPTVKPNVLNPATNPYPPGHPNLPRAEGTAPGTVGSDIPHEAASGVAGPQKALDMVTTAGADPVNDPLVPMPPTDPGAVNGAVDPSVAPRTAAFEHVRLAAQEFFNHVRMFGHDVDGGTDLGKLINFVRSEFLNRS